MPEKTIENYLIVNWKDGSTRTRKSKPEASSLGTHELATTIRLQIVIPEVEIDDLEARVEVPKPRVEQSALDDADAEDAPEWTDVADEYVERIVDRYGTDWSDYLDNADYYILQVIDNAPTNPDVGKARRYLKQKVSDRMKEKRDQ